MKRLIVLISFLAPFMTMANEACVSKIAPSLSASIQKPKTKATVLALEYITNRQALNFLKSGNAGNSHYIIQGEDFTARNQAIAQTSNPYIAFYYFEYDLKEGGFFGVEINYARIVLADNKTCAIKSEVQYINDFE